MLTILFRQPDAAAKHYICQSYIEGRSRCWQVRCGGKASQEDSSIHHISPITLHSTLCDALRPPTVHCATPFHCAVLSVRCSEHLCSLKQTAYIISLQQPIHSNPMCHFSPLCAAVLSVLFSTVLSLCARILTVQQLADTCVSAACSPNTCPCLCLRPPAGYKAFSNQRQLLSDQDCFGANIIRLEASTMALLRIIGESSVKCHAVSSKYLIPWKYPESFNYGHYHNKRGRMKD